MSVDTCGGSYQYTETHELSCGLQYPCWSRKLLHRTIFPTDTGARLAFKKLDYRCYRIQFALSLDMDEKPSGGRPLCLIGDGPKKIVVVNKVMGLRISDDGILTIDRQTLCLTGNILVNVILE